MKLLVRLIGGPHDGEEVELDAEGHPGFLNLEVGDCYELHSTTGPSDPPMVFVFLGYKEQAPSP